MRYLAITLIALGCTEIEEGLWIDNDCSELVEENLVIATERLWDEVGIDVEVLGRKDLSGIDLDPNEVTGVKCLSKADAPEKDVLGFGGNFGIILYGTDGLCTIMHELGHYVGMGHVDDLESIMYPYFRGNEHYTDADIASISEKH